jgi:hypothetical protein
MSNIVGPHNNGAVPTPQTSAATTGIPPASSTCPSSSPATRKRVFPPPVLPDGHRLQIPMAYLYVEPRPVWACNDNPVFNERGAAELIGVSAECLKKWRQRNQGPDYIQYGRSGPIRYELSALKGFREAHRVHVGSEL